MRKWVVVGMILILILVGGVAVQRRTRPAASTTSPPAAATGSATDVVAVEVVPVRRGSIERTLELSGSVVSAQRVELTMKTPGKIAAILVREGIRVAQGQALARLDASELAAQVAQAEQAVRQAKAGQEVARARLQALESGARAQERAQVLSAVAQAEASLRNAEANATRMEQLYESGAVSKQQLDAAILERDLARAQLESARQQWSMTETGARAEDIRMARAQVEQADAAYAAAQASLQLARVQLDNATLIAPFAGRIAEIPVAVGKYVAPGVTVAILYDDLNFEAEVKVGERDLHLIRPGQQVTLRPEATPGIRVRGVVRIVLPAADPESRAAKVRIQLLDPPTGVLPGTFVRGEVVIERREAALLIPTQALRQNGKMEVIVVQGETVEVRSIGIGLRHHHIVEVITGVREGELVVTLGPESLRNGQRVRVVNR